MLQTAVHSNQQFIPPMIVRHDEKSRTHLIYVAGAISGDVAELFEQSNWQDEQVAPTPSGSVSFFHFAGQSFALKRYRRRGMAANWLNSSYAWRPLAQTRMWREFHLLAQLRSINLPVPVAVAARCVYAKPWAYGGELITLRLPRAHNLRTLLQKSALDLDGWQTIGSTVGRFHRANVYHDDLNASNILIHDGGEVSLLDFDKCGFRTPSVTWELPVHWKESNLARLHHSLSKLKRRLEPFFFDAEAWLALLSGYDRVSQWPQPLEMNLREGS